ncbi:MAG TPA: glycoside hydrolase family 9 protein [Actinomycetota bacterium]|jgi:endoglucanase
MARSRNRTRPARSRVSLPIAAAAVLALLAACTEGSGASSGSSPGGSVPGAVPGATAYVRVNQVGYPTTGAKRAYLMSSTAESGAEFRVVDASGGTAYSAAVGASVGSWSSHFPFVYALDFNGVRAKGSYRISVHGEAAAESPSFRIDDGAALSAGPLANALFFYQAERDGPNFIRSALRTAPGHLHDAHAMTYLTPKVNGDGNFKGDLTPLGVRIDASGGWWDAGDYPKFVVTTSYTVDLLLAGVRDFPSSLGSRSTGSDFTAEARFGVEWLLKMWDDPTRTLYYQVGIGEGNDHLVGDHDIWRLPQADDTFGGTNPAFKYIRNRPVFRAAPPGSPVSPNIAGRDAAAFALCYQLFRVSDPSLAARCLLAGEHIFDLADTAPTGRLLTVLPFDFYPETSWRDDLELGATELYFALASGGTLPPGLPHTNAGHYLDLAAHWAHEYMTNPGDAADTLNLYDVSGFGHYELYRAIQRAGDPAGLEVTPAALLADMKKELDHATTQAARDPFGFGFPWNDYDTTTHGTGMAVEASEYDQLTHSNAFAEDGRRWLANVLGANAWGTSLIVGDGTTFPDCMQHQVANLVGSLDGSPPILRGAAVEGPNSFAAKGALEHMRRCPAAGGDAFAKFNGHGAVYQDNVQSYSTVEPAIDLTASSPLAFARQAAGLL